MRISRRAFIDMTLASVAGVVIPHTSAYAQSGLAKAVVIDNGSGVLRAGVEGSDSPGVRIEGVSANSRGVVEDWGAMASVWQQAYDQLGLKSSEHPLVLSEPPRNPKLAREGSAKIAFEELNVPALYMANFATLALFDVGKNTGVAVVLSDGVTYIVPVFEGFLQSHAAARMDMGAREVNGEIDPFFVPGIIGLNIPGIHGHIFNAVSKCDIDMRSELYSNIVLSGDGASMPDTVDDVGRLNYANGKNLREGVEVEVTNVAPNSMKVSVELAKTPEEGIWRGGSKFAPLLASNNLYMTAAHYEAEGASGVHRRLL